ncbi:hypothetical protein MRB53_040966 [Persea americana]|nr:hypothetical protein MRB53_040966 [Persea americana]
MAEGRGEKGNDEEFVSRGGSMVVGPQGDILAGPKWEVDDDTLLTVDVDFEDCERGRLDLGCGGQLFEE